MKKSVIWIGIWAAFFLFIVSGCGTMISSGEKYGGCRWKTGSWHAIKPEDEKRDSICYSEFMKPVPPVFGGVLFDLKMMLDIIPPIPPPIVWSVVIADLPLSFAADTLLLPLSIPKDVSCTRICKELEEAAAEEARKEKEAQERALSMENRPPILMWAQPNPPQISAVSPTPLPAGDYGTLRENPCP